MYTNAGCSRLVDYYFVVSCDDRGIGHIKEKLKHESLAPQNEKTARHAQFALKPKIIDRYPDVNHIDTPLSPWVARTSMPRGIRARTRPPAPTFFTFVGWNIDSSKLYGACLMVFEKIHIKNQLQTVYIPKTLGFLSHYPYFCAFDVFLRCLWHVIPKKLIALENLLIHYFYDIPAPAPSRKIAYDLGQMQVLLACRNVFDVPILELPMETAFTQLSKDRICFILKLLLLEKRVIFICGDMHQLTPVCELFVSLLFPLRWRHLYMPLLSHTMFQALMTTYNGKPKLNKYDSNAYRYREDAPFIVGLPRFVYLNPEIQNNMPINSFLVFLDRNEITDYKKKAIDPNEMKSGMMVPNLPNPLENALRDAIHTLARILTMQVDGIQQNNGRETQHQHHHHAHHQQQQQQHHNHHSHNTALSRSGSHTSHTLQGLSRSGSHAHSPHHGYNARGSNSNSNSNSSSTTVMGGHNSMFISREYTLQAFRTMFAVMTKLLYLSAHQQYANIMDTLELDMNGNAKKSKVDKYTKSAFIIKFRATDVFESFYAYYKRINGENDPYFKRMYLFYKENEGHGKHFARRHTNTWENEPFDRKLYDKEIFKISRETIRALESNNGKDNKLKKINEIAIKRSKKYRYPIPEFEMLEEVKDFLRIYIWRDSTKRHHHDRHHKTKSGSSRDYYSQSPRSRYSSRRGSKISEKRRRKGSKASHRKKRSKESSYYSPRRKRTASKVVSAASPASSTATYNLYPIPYENGKKSHHRSKSKSKSKSRLTKKRKARGRHVINTSNSLDITDMALQSKIEKFCQDLTQNKDNLEKSLRLCLDMEKKIQRKITKSNDIDKNEIMNDVGSIHGAAINIGYKSIDKSKGMEHWKMVVYDIFKLDVHGKQNLVTIIGKLCGQYPEHKGNLVILRGVVALFDEELSIASMSVRSLFLNQTKSANSQGSVSTNTTTTTDTGTTTSTEDDNDESPWDEESEEEEDEEEDEKSKKKKEKRKRKESGDWDDEDEDDEESTDDSTSNDNDTESDESTEESGSDLDLDDETCSTTSSSGWTLDSKDDFDDEKEKDGSFTFDGHGGCKFTKLDEFALDKEEIEWFDKCESLHKDELGVDGMKYIDHIATNQEWIAANFMDDYLVEKWKKNYKQRLKNKKKEQHRPLLSPNALNKEKSSDVAIFNINHSVNHYKDNRFSPFITSPKGHTIKGMKPSSEQIQSVSRQSSSSSSKYSRYKPPPPPSVSSSRSPKPPPKTPKKTKPPKPPKKSSPSMNISPKSQHSSKLHQHHHLQHKKQQYYTNYNGNNQNNQNNQNNHNNQNNSHNNHNNHNGHHYHYHPSKDEEVYVD